MGTPAIPSAADRLEAVKLTDLIMSQIEADESLPVIGEDRAWLLAAEITELRDEAEDNERTWREALEALQAKQLELEKVVDHDLRLRVAAETVKDELLVKLSVQERAEARGREERDARLEQLQRALMGGADVSRDNATQIAKAAAACLPPSYYTGPDFEPHQWVVDAVVAGLAASTSSLVVADKRIAELEAGLQKLVGDRDAMHDRAMAAEEHLGAVTEGLRRERDLEVDRDTTLGLLQAAGHGG